MEVKTGNTVTVEYEGKFESGEVFDSSQHGEHHHPLTFVVGAKQVIPGFDSAVLGMKDGEEKEVTIKPEEAYGEKRDDLEKEIPRNVLPKEQEPKAGMTLLMGTPDGRQFPVQIKKVGEENITIDLNHPMAGKTLIFKIKIVKIEEADSTKSE